MMRWSFLVAYNINSALLILIHMTFESINSSVLLYLEIEFYKSDNRFN